MLPVNEETIHNAIAAMDSRHDAVPFFENPFSKSIWGTKYRYLTEPSMDHTIDRVVDGVFANDSGRVEFWKATAATLMRKGVWMPAGRILAGAGTAKRVTLVNCFVNGTLRDDLASIMEAHSNTMLTMQMGGGMGTDFSPLRPTNAILKRTFSKASGPLPFMDMWDAGSNTIQSAGDRSGAMMGTISDTHPDMPLFVTAKQQKGRMKSFNVSVLVSEAFMDAIKEDEDWVLHFPCEPAERESWLSEHDFTDDNGEFQYAYSVWKARDLWAMITKNTYEWSEPGIIFIDRVNDLNNLHYCEEIRCTNPCVTGDTLILTDKGHIPIFDRIGFSTKVWNGEQFSEVVPFGTGENDILAIKFSNGHTVKCTHYHKWVLHDGTRITAKELVVGDKLLYADMPTIVEGEKYSVDAYSQGFYCGDGCKDSSRSNLYKHNDGIKDRLVGKFWRADRSTWVHGNGMYPKDFVPVNGELGYCINYLAGLLDADGCVAKKKDTNVLEISAKDRSFLHKVGLMLNRLGVNHRMWERKDAGLKRGSNGKMYECENTAAVMISHKGAHRLVQLGLKCERVDLSYFQNAPNGVARVGHRVVSITPMGKEPTYCFTEPLRNMGVFNGVIGANCGEQPLPPHGACNLGANVLSRLVIDPFSDNARMNWDLLEISAYVGQRFLDNVIDVSAYPLPEQGLEQRNKRRTGNGIAGLADALHQMGIRYGSYRAQEFAEEVMRRTTLAAYRCSIDLAKERGAFPLFDADGYLAPNTFAGRMLPEELRADIRRHGIRNGVLMTIAPTGTTSCAYGDIASGLEPTFEHEYDRNVRQGFGDNFKRVSCISYSARLWKALKGDLPYPSYMVTTSDLSLEDHLTMQGRVQRWVDASVSKTINLPEDLPYEQFVKVYDLAYSLGAKGCTTYRPSDVRGSILVRKSDTVKDEPQAVPETLSRPPVLKGTTYQLKWPRRNAAVYLTINELENGQPFEVFITSKDGSDAEWTTALTLMITAIFRKGGDPSFLCKELMQVQSVAGGAWIPYEKRYFDSLPAYVGYTIQKHLLGGSNPKDDNVSSGDQTDTQTDPSPQKALPQLIRGKECPSCHREMLIKVEGCDKCTFCTYSKCG